jgi:hypothetical protein
MHFQKHYGFMYQLWRDEWCWWESVLIFQTICLVVVCIFGFSLGPAHQTMVTTAVLAVVGMLLLAVKPYKCIVANKVAVTGLFILSFTACSVVTFLPYSGMPPRRPGPVYNNIMAVVLVLLNLAYLSGTAWMLLRVVDWEAIKSFVSCRCST